MGVCASDNISTKSLNFRKIGNSTELSTIRSTATLKGQNTRPKAFPAGKDLATPKQESTYRRAYGFNEQTAVITSRPRFQASSSIVGKSER